MNILNFEAQKVNSLDEIVEKQKEIMFAFEPNLKQRVEEFDIDIYEDQMLLKEFLLERTVEEITEATIAMKNHHIEHYKEEIVDVFNFLVETKIILGKDFSIIHSEYNEHYNTGDPDQINVYFFEEGVYFDGYYTLNYDHTDKTIDELRKDILPRIYELVESIGNMTNLLKQRPWRQSQYPVDLLTLKIRWQGIIDRFWELQLMSGFNLNEFKAIWSKKYQVNKFRIESNY